MNGCVGFDMSTMVRPLVECTSKIRVDSTWESSAGIPVIFFVLVLGKPMAMVLDFHRLFPDISRWLNVKSAKTSRYPLVI